MNLRDTTLIALLLAASVGCSGRAGGGVPDGGPGPAPAYPPGYAPGYPPGGGPMVGSSPLLPVGGAQTVPSPAQVKPLATDTYVKEVAVGSPAAASSYTGRVAFSPDGQWYAYGYQAQGTSQAILHVGEVFGAAKSTNYVASGQIWWAPDSRRLAFAQQTTAQQPPSFVLRSWDVEAGRIGTLQDQVSADFPWAAWVDKGVVFIQTTVDPAGPTVTDLVYKPLDADSARLASVIDSHPGTLGTQAIYPSPDGKRLAFLAEAPGFTAAASLVVHDLDSGMARAVRRVPKDLGPLVWDPASNALAFLSGGFGQYEIHRVSIGDGSEEVTPFYLGEPVIESGPNWRSVSGPFASHLSPDLKWCLVTRGGPLYARELATGKHVQITSAHAVPAAWTSDSRFVFVYVAMGGALERTLYYKVQVER